MSGCQPGARAPRHRPRPAHLLVDAQGIKFYRERENEAYAGRDRGQPVLHERTEYCGWCDEETPHAVTLGYEQHETRSPNQGGHYSDPHRVTECQECGTVDDRRIAAHTNPMVPSE